LSEVGRTWLSPPMRRLGLLRALEVVGLSALPAAVLGVAVVEAQRAGVLAIDFRNVSGPIRGLPHGTDPYVVANVGDGGHFLWTVLAGWLLLPFALIPGGYVLLVALEAAGVAGAALLLGVRDWRLIAGRACVASDGEQRPDGEHHRARARPARDDLA